ncbi:hypothetical protein DFR30_1506 [Thiogranum longum]|uniref:Uncharacterized protein n=1 Tax=Thiogranum longum TaxID=1537524 RepID=A0A4R1HC90_9GAMM|nr:hypothetical protein [Thiogranum longum]TCK18231.1 hypothetical protein DFR30_1506 [Thiogranum longum]
MRIPFYTLILMAYVQLLTACSESPALATEFNATRVNNAHSVFIQDGILKLLKANEHTVLYVYIRPGDSGLWLATGGGGGIQDKPWLFKSAASWTLGDDGHKYTRESPTRSFSFIFDSRNMTLTTESGSYAVREGDMIVITLDSNWKTGSVKSGINALYDFDIPVENSQQLVKEARKYYSN